MFEKSLYIERTSPLLLTAGLFLHLVNLGHYMSTVKTDLRKSSSRSWMVRSRRS